MNKATLSIPEAAVILGIGRSAGYEAARRGEIPTIRIGKRILVPIGALAMMLKAPLEADGIAGKENADDQ